MSIKDRKCDDCPPSNLAIKLALQKGEQVDQIRECRAAVTYFHDLILDAYPCIHQCEWDLCEELSPTACPAVQAKLYFTKHPRLKMIISPPVKEDVRVG